MSELATLEQSTPAEVAVVLSTLDSAIKEARTFTITGKSDRVRRSD